MLFFFQSYVDHRHLHSFPTRRSSDLRAQDHQDRIPSACLDQSYDHFMPFMPPVLPSCAPRICQSPIPIWPIIACMLDVEANLLSASNKNCAEVTTRSPSLMPCRISTRSWLRLPTLTG